MAAPQEVVPVDGEPFAGELMSIDADARMTFRVLGRNSTTVPATAPGTMRNLQLDELVRWGSPVSARPQTIVVLTDGGQLVTAADWSGGAAVRLEGDKIVVLSDAFGEVRLPRSRVHGCVFAQRNHPAERARLIKQVQSASGDGDIAWLTNQDRLGGELIELSRGSLTIKTQGGAAKLPLSRVEAVALADGRQDAAVSRPSKLVVGMRDGSLLYADSIRAGESDLRLDVDGLELEGGSAEDVVAMQSLGGVFVYLSDLDPANYRHVPYLSIEWPYKRDRNVAGDPLVVGGKRYLKGIGTHSASRLTYRLDGKYRRFDATVAVDDSADARGSVTFGVYVHRNEKWEEAHMIAIVRGGDAPVPVSIDVAGAQALTLTVDYADRGDELDRADWLDARLIR